MFLPQERSCLLHRLIHEAIKSTNRPFIAALTDKVKQFNAKTPVFGNGSLPAKGSVPNMNNHLRRYTLPDGSVGVADTSYHDNQHTLPGGVVIDHTVKYKRLEPGSFGSFSPKTKEITINSNETPYAQTVTLEHEEAHKAHDSYISISDPEDLIMTEFVAWHRDALKAVDLVDKEGYKLTSSSDKQMYAEAKKFIKAPEDTFYKIMMGSYSKQIDLFIKNAGRTESSEQLLKEILAHRPFSKDATK